MAWTMWAFQFKDDIWTRVTWQWYQRFTAGESQVEEPEGTLLRFALVSVKLVKREPESAKEPSYAVHEVAEHGFIKQDRENQARRAAMEMTFGGMFVKDDDDDSNVIAASSKFARRQYEHLAKWQPTHEQKEALLRVLRSLGVGC